MIYQVKPHYVYIWYAHRREHSHDLDINLTHFRLARLQLLIFQNASLVMLHIYTHQIAIPRMYTLELSGRCTFRHSDKKPRKIENLKTAEI